MYGVDLFTMLEVAIWVVWSGVMLLLIWFLVTVLAAVRRLRQRRRSYR
jgi:hypothetical protein